MKLFEYFSEKSRKSKLRLFFEYVSPCEYHRILDVGGEVGSQPNKGMHLVDVYPWKGRITVINTSCPAIESVKTRYPQVMCVLGDGRQLPWSNKYFDIVYSNAVIEHVGGPEDQRRMAREIMRVGKRWFVATPNRWYPFEFHMRLPFVTWLPGQAYLFVGRLIAYNHVTRRYKLLPGAYAGLRLLSAKELQACFPSSQIIRVRITFMAETLIVVGGCNK